MEFECGRFLNELTPPALALRWIDRWVHSSSRLMDVTFESNDL